MKDRLLTTEDANKLLHSNKVVTPASSSVRFSFSAGKPNVSFKLVSTDLPKEESFLLSIRKSEKKLAKITFHHMHDDSVQCLFRLDINGTHKNPEQVNEKVPEEFRKYAGELLLESHVHCYVEGYDDSWAIPLRETDFSDWESFSNIENEIQGMLDVFCRCINLSTEIFYDQKLPL